ncbi:hypothetical protein [Verrucosispora sp. WMMD573]|nr:hypothetical protein [Verrucosispora sp. WMMD573]WBB56657.1 hypothetical protein O7601_11635 [Verrucosispora sp. WMMD573]
MSRRIKIAFAALALVVGASAPIVHPRQPVNDVEDPAAGFSWGMPLR